MKKYQAIKKITRIEGVQLKPTIIHCDERGRLMEILKCNETFFNEFGQVYLTTAYPGVTKAWHFHTKQEDNMCVVRGMMKIVCYDDRKNSSTRGVVNEFFIGDHHPAVLKIPPGVYHGFKCISEHEALVINTVTKPYNPSDPDEFRIAPHSKKIPYDWSRKDG